jgi:hypothetical protein
MFLAVTVTFPPMRVSPDDRAEVKSAATFRISDGFFSWYAVAIS